MSETRNIVCSDGRLLKVPLTMPDSEISAIKQGKPYLPGQTPPESQIKAYTDDELRSLAKNKLIEITTKQPANVSLVAAIRELLDRIDGKPAQAVTMNANVNVVTVNAQVRFISTSSENMKTISSDGQQVIENE